MTERTDRIARLLSAATAAGKVPGVAVALFGAFESAIYGMV